MMFNRETEYALRALVHIQLQNYDDRRPGGKEIAQETGAPYYYTAKILQRLVRQGLLCSLKGKGGGFYFDKGKPDLMIRDLILAIEGEKKITGCVFGLTKCDEKHPCPFHDQYAPIREAMARLVSGESIQSVAKKYFLNTVNGSPDKVK
ncbi:MAG: Rrf2 family transcriptional regulator [Bacteroidales bacterium]|jgi:Rrf2 family protein|nr:Rrf2 family transcriptional regulator [Bacteroidales bacterium]